MPDDNNKKLNNFNNFDDFLDANNLPKPPKNDQVPDLPDLPDYNAEESANEPKPVIKSDFWGYFPRSSISLNVIKDLIKFPQDRFEKLMGICMILVLAATFNPIIVGIYAFDMEDPYRYFFLAFMILFFAVSVIFSNKSIWLPGIVLFAAAKAVPFSESRADTLLAAAFMTMIILLYRMKKTKDSENTELDYSVYSNEQEKSDEKQLKGCHLCNNSGNVHSADSRACANQLRHGAV